MTDPRFYTNAGPFSLGEIAQLAKTKLSDDADPGKQIVDVAPLDRAGSDELSFLDNKDYVDVFANSAAGACIVHPEFAARAPRGMALLLTEKPYPAYAHAARAFHPPHRLEPGISPRADIDPEARLGPDCRVESGAVIGSRAEIGARAWIGTNAVIGPGVVMGDDCRVGAGAAIFNSLVGHRVAIYSGARIGQDGFGFAPDPAEHLKVPQLGRVIIGDDVEIGANSTVDRGSGPDTIIGERCMIDNLVQIAHNVQLGPGCVIVAQVGISGSTKIEDYVFIGGQAGLTGHLKIGAGARIAAQSGVMRDIAPGTIMGGSPAVPIRDWHRQNIRLARLAEKKEA